MDKLCISNILGVAENEIIGDNTPIDSKHKSNDWPPRYSNIDMRRQIGHISVRREVDDILRVARERKINKIKSYKSILLECVRQVKRDNNMGKTDTFYCVPHIAPMYPEYDFDECVDFLLIELKKYMFDITLHNYDTIFISWKFAEFHKRSHVSSNTNY